MKFPRAFSACLLLAFGASADAADILMKPVPIAEMKAVYGEVQARDMVLARARIPGTLVELKVSEGDVVEAGDVIARIKDDRIEFQIKAVDAQLLGLQASLENARAELERSERLLKSGATTAQRVGQMQTEVSVTENQIRSAEAERSVLTEQMGQGDVLAPSSGKVLGVPLTRSAVVMAGETVATIGGGGFYLRLAVPERHAEFLKQGASISIEAAGHTLSGTLAKIYPLIASGRVTVDVEVANLSTDFVGNRVLVQLPVGERRALLVPAGAIATRAGLDFVSVRQDGKAVERTVIPGAVIMREGKAEIEVLTGLAEGDTVIAP